MPRPEAPSGGETFSRLAEEAKQKMQRNIVFMGEDFSYGKLKRDPQKIRAVQNIVNAFGFNIAVDGDYGPITREYVRKMQRQIDLPPAEQDGLFGRKTMEKVKEFLQQQETAEGAAVEAKEERKQLRSTVGSINAMELNSKESIEEFLRNPDPAKEYILKLDSNSPPLSDFLDPNYYKDLEFTLENARGSKMEVRSNGQDWMVARDGKITEERALIWQGNNIISNAVRVSERYIREWPIEQVKRNGDMWTVTHVMNFLDGTERTVSRLTNRPTDEAVVLWQERNPQLAEYYERLAKADPDKTNQAEDATQIDAEHSEATYQDDSEQAAQGTPVAVEQHEPEFDFDAEHVDGTEIGDPVIIEKSQSEDFEPGVEHMDGVGIGEPVSRR